jgi:hypothetical protein
MKRSSSVALLLMGMGGVGATSYALAPPRDCAARDNTQPAAVAAAADQPAQDCRRRWSSSSRSYFYSSDNNSSSWFSSTSSRNRNPSVVPRSASHTTPVTRGGFGRTGSFHSALS